MTTEKQKTAAPFSNIGASTHGNQQREENDYYSTDESAIRLLHNHNLLDKSVPYWETAVGGGRLAKELIRLGYNVTKATDLYDRGYGETGIDFFKCNEVFEGNLITNPPYEFINEWIKHSIDLAANKSYVFCRIQTIEGVKRWRIFKKHRPLYICPFVKRVQCYRNNDTSIHNSAVCYSWFIWDNTVDNTETYVRWLI